MKSTITLIPDERVVSIFKKVAGSLQGKNIDTSADLSTASGTLKYGDMIVYSGNYNGLVFGWFIGLSLTGKTTYVLSANGSVVSPFYTPIKFNWTSGINDLRIKNIDEQFELIEKHRP